MKCKSSLFYLSFLVLTLLIFFGVGVNRSYATVLHTWDNGTIVITLDNDYTLHWIGSTPSIILNNGFYSAGGGGLTNTYPYESVNNALFANFGVGNWNGYICFVTPADPTCISDLVFFNLNVIGIDTFVDLNATSTRISSFTFSTTTNTARIIGYWNATSTTGITERLEFSQFSTLLGIESFQQVIATTTGIFDQSFDFKGLPTPYTGTTTAPFVTDTTLFARIYQYNNNYATDPFSGVFDSRYKTLLVSTSTTITQLTGINIATSTRNLFAYPEYECGISSLTGCFKNALIWAFYPTEDGVIQYYSFINLIESKAPIGYFFVARDAIQGLNKDGTPSNNVVIPYSIKHYIFSPFDVGIAGILWLFFLFSFYKRLKFITI